MVIIDLSYTGLDFFLDDLLAVPANLPDCFPSLQTLSLNHVAINPTTQVWCWGVVLGVLVVFIG
jgi:hypothetical protein